MAIAVAVGVRARDLHDRRPEPDATRLRGEERQRRDRVGAVRLGRPHRIEAEALGLAHLLDGHLQTRAGPDVETEPELHGAECSRSPIEAPRTSHAGPGDRRAATSSTARERRAQRADVGVRDGRIVEIGKIDEAATRTIDADGRVVAPGFVDVHTHYDAQVFWDPTLSPSPLHGVTTVLGGNCGFTIAPLVPREAEYLMKMLARVEGMPLDALAAGVPWDWTTTAEYFDHFDNTLAVNAGFMVGHCALRRVVMGERSVGNAATDDDLTAMVEPAPRVARRRRLGFLVVVGRDPQRCRRRAGAVAARDHRRAAGAVPGHR